MSGRGNMSELRNPKQTLALLCADLMSAFSPLTDKKNKTAQVRDLILQIQKAGGEIISEYMELSSKFKGIAKVWPRLHQLLEDWVALSKQSLNIPELTAPAHNNHPKHDKLCKKLIGDLEKFIEKDKNTERHFKKTALVNHLKEFIVSLLVINAHLRLIESPENDNIRRHCLQAYNEFLEAQKVFDQHTYPQMQDLANQMAQLMEECNLLVVSNRYSLVSAQTSYEGSERGAPLESGSFFGRILKNLWAFLSAVFQWPLRFFQEPVSDLPPPPKTAQTAAMPSARAPLAPRRHPRQAVLTSPTPQAQSLATSQQASETLSLT